MARSLAAKSGRNPMVLAVCQALYTIGTSIQLTLSGIVGYELAADKALATLPFALITVGAALTTVVAAMVMQRFGRRIGFAAGALCAALGGLVSAYAVMRSGFWLFCLGSLLGGVFQGFAQFYPIAAADSVASPLKSRAIATVLTGGVFAAIAGPWLAAHSKDLIAGVPFAGAYGLAAVLALASAALVLALLSDVEPEDAAAETGPARPLPQIMAQPAFVTGILTIAAGFAAMVLVMTAAPLAAIACSYTVNDGAGIIQWHLLGMFAPSFVSGRLVARFGIARTMAAGMALIAACLAIAMSSTALPAFYAALFSLGIGWNLMMVSGTTVLSRAYRPSERGKTQAVAGLIQNVSSAGAALLAGALLAGGGWSMVNLSALPILVVGLVALGLWTLRPTPATGNA